ncbi:hypothetical protein M951_chr3142 (nucleomorph) [Lotharella oceanica]|uniref:Uncharacterized protein n=1 Tax=Lotharella oceanica TaxID=641309 RepID=A0A060DC22_9EUKA|nr:hypothetical protein M951_chr3142 [Lotharella oceanica]
MHIYFKINNLHKCYFLDFKRLLKKKYLKLDLKNIFQRRRDIFKIKKKCKKYVVLNLIFLFYILRNNIFNRILFFSFLNLQYIRYAILHKTVVFKQFLCMLKYFQNKAIFLKINNDIFFNNFLKIKKKKYFKFILNELYFFYIKRKIVFNI